MFGQYVSNFKKLFDLIECTDPQGRIDVEHGIKKVIARIEKLRTEGNKMFWIGNGGSASIAVHSTLDYFRTGNIKTQAFYDGPMLTCLGNDFEYAAVFEKPLEIYSEPADMLVAISSSGKSENILRGVGAVQKKKCFIVTLSGFQPDNPLRKLGDINFYIPSNHYGQVEMIHAVLCHGFLDLLMQKKNGDGNIG